MKRISLEELKAELSKVTNKPPFYRHFIQIELDLDFYSQEELNKLWRNLKPLAYWYEEDDEIKGLRVPIDG